MFLVALAVLAILAGTGGYLGTRQMLGNGNPSAAGNGSRTSTPPPKSEEPNPAGTGGGAVVTAEPTTPNVTTSTTDPGTVCPTITDQAVRDAGRPAELTLVIYVRLRRSGATPAEAWVCKAKDGTLYYQGHLLSRPLEVVNSDHSILLGTGLKGEVKPEGDGFVAINTEPDGKITEYHVSQDAFALVNVPGLAIPYEVVRSFVP